MNSQDVIVIHGGSCWSSYAEYLNDLKSTDFAPDASPSNNWQRHLQEKLGSRFRVLLPAMPNWQNAKYLEWRIWFNHTLRFSTPTPIIVGHSLGGIFLIKYFAEERTTQQIKGLFLVSTPFKTMRENPEFGNFALKRIPLNLKKYGERITFYHSIDDQIVAFDDLKRYQSILPDATFRTFERRGHFSQNHFPALVRDLKGS